MRKMRVGTWNVEWFTNLFDDHDRPLADDAWSGRHNVTRAAQLDAIGIVMTALDADALMIIEAPDTNGSRQTTRALETLASGFGLRTRRAVTGFANDTQQEIALLYDPDRLSARHDPIGEPTGKKGSPEAPRFDGVFRIDLNSDGQDDLVSYSKPPLELACQTTDGMAFRMIGVHVKSKAPHGARTPDEIMRLGIENRRKQLAQCVWLRQRVDEHLARAEPLMVLGDFNDGPGLDEYERLFGRSGVEIVLGDGDGPPMYDPHARLALGQRIGAMPATARFWMAHEDQYVQALLDYIMVSPDLRKRDPVWRIWHPFDDPVCYRNIDLREALLTASDHFPVTVNLQM